MKKYMMIIAVALLGMGVYAQDTVKNDYVLEGDLIKATLYHDNGLVSQTGYYTKKGKLQGQWTSFDREGVKTAVAQYDNGEKVGKWFFWTGNILREVDYQDSRIAEVTTYETVNQRIVSID
ncbi:toxin-antitoxin system YwqK family antitoxin [Croceiramulus getboli]|nr:nicotinic acid mononucleotide adenyltransferase [Flavobacteriaceae bacterium YJPT1-3]